MKKTNTARNFRMLQMYVKENMTLEEIGKVFHMTRQGVCYIIGGMPGYEEHKKRHKKDMTEWTTSPCKHCGQIINYHIHYKKIFCNKICHRKWQAANLPFSKYGDRLTLLKNLNEKQKHYYHTVIKKLPHFKEMVREQNRRATLRRNKLKK